MFGPIIDVPVMSGVFAGLMSYSKRLVRLILKIPLPRMALALLCAIPLLTFEEHINCGAYGCTNVIIPPTIWFLLFEQLVVFLMLYALHSKKILLPTILYAIFGILFEFLIGAAQVGLHQLAASNPLVFILLMLWVGFSYMFVIILPLMVLNAPKEK